MTFKHTCTFCYKSEIEIEDNYSGQVTCPNCGARLTFTRGVYTSGSK